MNRFKNVLCVVDSEHVSEPALGRAVALSVHNQASLTVVDVVEQVTVDIGMLDGGVATADMQAVIVKTQAQDLDALVEPYRSQIDITTRILVDVPFLAIIRDVLRHGHDLLIKIAASPRHCHGRDHGRRGVWIVFEHRSLCRGVPSGDLHGSHRADELGVQLVAATHANGYLAVRVYSIPMAVAESAA